MCVCVDAAFVLFLCYILFIWMGFIMPSGEKFSDLDDLIESQDQLADVAGCFSMSTIFESSARHMWMFGWPHGLILMWSDVQGVPEATVARFHAYFLLSRQFAEWDGKGASDKVVADRDVFNLVTNQRYVHGFEEAEWKAFGFTN